MRKRIFVGGLFAAIVAVGSRPGVQRLRRQQGGESRFRRRRAARCSTRASGSPQLLIATDLPLQGAGRAQLIAMGKAVRYVLQSANFKAGKFTVGYQECDDSTAQTGAWDSAKCSSNARAYAAEKNLVGVLGTFNSGCAKLEVPILNRAAGGAVAMLSSANTAVGLTHLASWNDPGEPKIYYPTGVRNYARVAATDDYQGPAAADMMVKLATSRASTSSTTTRPSVRASPTRSSCAPRSSGSRSSASNRGIRRRPTTPPSVSTSRTRARSPSTSAASSATTA